MIQVSGLVLCRNGMLKSIIGLLSLGQISLFPEPLFGYRLHTELWTSGAISKPCMWKCV
jgi:hypothetical protein